MTLERISLIVFVLFVSLYFAGVKWWFIPIVAAIAGFVWVLVNIIEGFPRR